LTLVEMLVVLAIVAVVVALLLPTLSAARNSARKLLNTSNLRNIQQATVVFGHDHQQRYPGLKSKTTRSAEQAFYNRSEFIDRFAEAPDQWAGPSFHTGARFFSLLANGYLSADLLISPVEPDGGVRRWEPGRAYGLTDSFYSYALPSLQTRDNTPRTPYLAEGRIGEWQVTASPHAVTISDRGIPRSDRTRLRSAEPASVASLWSNRGWAGTVIHNDGHGSFRTSPVLGQTRHAQWQSEADHLFLAGDQNTRHRFSDKIRRKDVDAHQTVNADWTDFFHAP
jgi:type II secretory pathway pseudopilin PulG